MMKIALIAFLLHMYNAVAYLANQFWLALGVTVNMLEGSSTSCLPW